MQIELVQCLVRLNLNGKTDLMQVVKSGPDAVPVTEIPLLRAKHDVGSGMVAEECSISRAEVVGAMETTKAQEVERLMLKYGKKAVDMMYPQGRQMPLTLADCELPAGCVVTKPKKGRPAKATESKPAPVAVEPDDFDRAFWISELQAAGVEIPATVETMTEAELLALADAAGLFDNAA